MITTNQGREVKPAIGQLIQNQAGGIARIIHVDDKGFSISAIIPVAENYDDATLLATNATQLVSAYEPI